MPGLEHIRENIKEKDNIPHSNYCIGSPVWMMVYKTALW